MSMTQTGPVPGLKDENLLRNQAFIDGAWVDADFGAVIAVNNPALLSQVGQVPRMGAAETRRAIAAAHRAFPAWAGRPAKERAGLMRAWFDLIVANTDDLARIMTAEQGKPLAEATGEIAYAASFVEWFAEEAKRAYGDVIPSPQGDRRIFTLKQPIGVCGAITPWNFPASMITRKISPALAAGCCVVLKPASATPLTALALIRLAERAGIPSGVLSIVTGNAKEIGGELTGNPLVRKISFTGSTETGKQLMAQASGTVKKVSLELGGNAPFIVFDDADLDAAVKGAVASKFRNMGQTCVCANRIFVQSSIYDAFAEKLTVAVKALKIGDGFAEGITQGPLIDHEAVEKVQDHIADATSKGAKILTGGKQHLLGGTFFEPTVLSGVTPAMKVMHEETFGPLAPLFRFGDEAEAIKLANDTEYGLAAYFYAKDAARIWRVAEALEYGMVGVNTGAISNEVMPFGGVKESGIGREGSKYGIEEYLEIKAVTLAGL